LLVFNRFVESFLSPLIRFLFSSFSVFGYALVSKLPLFFNSFASTFERFIFACFSSLSSFSGSHQDPGSDQIIPFDQASQFVSRYTRSAGGSNKVYKTKKFCSILTFALVAPSRLGIFNRLTQRWRQCIPWLDGGLCVNQTLEPCVLGLQFFDSLAFSSSTSLLDLAVCSRSCKIFNRHERNTP
jgi:hypothetical protein